MVASGAAAGGSCGPLAISVARGLSLHCASRPSGFSGSVALAGPLGRFPGSRPRRARRAACAAADATLPFHQTGLSCSVSTQTADRVGASLGVGIEEHEARCSTNAETQTSSPLVVHCEARTEPEMEPGSGSMGLQSTPFRALDPVPATPILPLPFRWWPACGEVRWGHVQPRISL